MAFCQRCGSQMPDDAVFCPQCGAQGGQNPNIYQTYQAQPELPMKWYKFLIYFSLFLAALSNGATGATMLVGGQYEGYADMVYTYFPVLKTIDIVVGIGSLAIAVFAIVVRQKLAKFTRDAPSMLTLLYVASIALSAGYVLAVMALVHDISVDTTQVIAQLCLSGVMVFVNKIYFEKRKHLFVN